MKKSCSILIDRLSELEQIIKQSQKFLSGAPDGMLRITQNKNTQQYYIRTNPEDFSGKYIKKSNEKLIKDLAQKDYAQRVRNAAVAEKNNIQQFLKKYHPEKICKIYDSLPQSRRCLVTPYILSDKDYAAKWEQEEYTAKYKPEKEDNIIYTEKHEAVRSKSEKILADKFKTMNIPYHYEKPLFLEGYGLIYPDFTVLNKRTRKEYYWEHMGLMDDKDYCEKAIKKIESMARNRIIQGKNLILTYETQTHPLNIGTIEALINEYLI